MRRSDVIAIEGLLVDCVVGVYPHERGVLQPLQVDLYMHVDTRAAGQREQLRESVDYAAIGEQLVFLLSSCRFGMLETAAHALIRYLLLPPALGERRAQIRALRLRLKKPEALRGLAVPYLEVVREAEEVSLVTEDSKFGNVDIVFETREAGIYRLNVAPGCSIPLHMHRQMREAEMVLSDGLLCQGKPVRSGATFRWALGEKHCYDNPTRRYQSILCVDSPPFIPDDEIEVEGVPDDVPCVLPMFRSGSGKSL